MLGNRKIHYMQHKTDARRHSARDQRRVPGACIRKCYKFVDDRMIQIRNLSGINSLLR